MLCPYWATLRVAPRQARGSLRVGASHAKRTHPNKTAPLLLRNFFELPHNHAYRFPLITYRSHYRSITHCQMFPTFCRNHNCLAHSHDFPSISHLQSNRLRSDLAVHLPHRKTLEEWRPGLRLKESLPFLFVCGEMNLHLPLHHSVTGAETEEHVPGTSPALMSQWGASGA